MSLYRRFVTYLFRYENGKKGANCGFAKVEVRQEQCRMELQIKGYGNGECAVHLFVNAENRIEGIHIGDVRVKNGMGREIFLFATEPVGGTPYNMDEVSGIYITVDGDGFIASQWNDEEIQWNSFRVYETPLETETETDGGKQETIMPAERVPEKSISEEGLPEEHASGKSMSEECASKERISEDSITEKQISGSREEKTEKIENLSLPQSSSEMQATQTAAASRISSCMTAWEQQWQRFTALHPVFQPFDEEQNICAIKLELRDLRALPKQYWSLANNSFLLHGYFNYKYLLFGYMDGERKRWFLGVPGSFQNQEQLLAGIFGFTEFKTKHVTKQRTGEFGYWYRYLDL